MTDWDRMMRMDGATLELEVVAERTEAGRSFSEDAMDALLLRVSEWIGTRISRHWAATGQPPTEVRITVTVEVQ